MRILLIADRYWPEARSAAYLFRSLAEELVRRGHSVLVLTKAPTTYVPQEEARSFAVNEELNGVQIIRVKGVRSSTSSIAGRVIDQLWMAIRISARAFRIKRPDAIIVYSPPLPLAIAAALHRWCRRVPYVLHLHDLYPQTAIDLGMLKNRAVIWIARIAARIASCTASQIIVPFARSREIVLRENSVPSTKICVVSNWVDNDSFADENRSTDFRREYHLQQRFVVMYAGLMGLAQDLGPVVDCAKEVQHHTDIVFVFMGDGALANHWRDSCRELSNVIFLPPANDKRYAQAVEGSDVCLVPLSAELKSPAIPGKLQTIMALARPALVIVPPWNDTVGLVKESNCGLLVTSGKASDVKKALIRLYQEPSLRRELGQNGFRYACEHFTLPQAVGEFERILAVIVQAPGQQNIPRGR